MNRHIIVIALLSSLTGCGGGGCDDPTTMDDFCFEPGVGSATSVEIGVDRDGVFEPVVDDQVVDRVFGGQGFAMLGVALRFTGPDIPGCIAQSTEVHNTIGELVASEDLGVNTYAGSDGTYTTSTIFLILGDVGAGARVRVTVDAAGQTAERTLFLDYSVDAGVDTDAGPNVDAGTPIDALGPDAAIPDSGI